MFGNKNDRERAESHVETIIGAESSFEGTLRSKKSVRIDGKFDGSVASQGVIVGERGEVQGDISARTVLIGGKVTGNIHATESLELLAKSQVYGDLQSPQLSIADRAIFDGSCLMASEKADIIGVNVNFLPRL